MTARSQYGKRRSPHLQAAAAQGVDTRHKGHDPEVRAFTLASERGTLTTAYRPVLRLPKQK
jgi:hypothetical protein